MSKPQRRVLTAEDLALLRQWRVPEVGEPAAGSPPPRPPEPAPVVAEVRPPTAADVEAIERAAYDEGFACGRAEGETRGHAEALERAEASLRSQAEHLASILQTLASPLQDLDAQVEQALVTLALSVARQLVRRELKIDPGQVIAVVREAVSALPLASGELRLYLHPEDAALVRQVLAVKDGEGAWHIVEDPVLTPGGCRLVTETSQIDATVEARLNAVIARVLGGERGSDRGG
jgi:flagellar assembly protein FliH